MKLRSKCFSFSTLGFIALLMLFSCNSDVERTETTAVPSPSTDLEIGTGLNESLPRLISQMPAVERAAMGASVGGGGHPALVLPTYRQRIVHGPLDAQQPMAHRLKVVTDELDPSTGDWFVSTVEHSASFKIDRVVTRISNELYLSGVARNGDLVIEQWIVTPQTGAVLPVRPAAETGIGVPFSTPPLTTQIQGDGAFIPPPQRQDRSVTVKTELYRGSELGEIVSMAVDPDGRFLLVLTSGSHGLVQFDLHDSTPTGPAYQTICSPSTLPEIQQVKSIYPAAHENGIRMFIMAPRYMDGVIPKNVVLLDDDNDGVFDGDYELTPPEFKQLFPPGSISDYFTIYY